VAGCGTEAEALRIIQTNYRNGSMLVDFEDDTKNRLVSLADMPLIVLGSVFDTQQPGAILCQDGKWVKPNGSVLAVTSPNSFETVILSNGFTVLSYFSPDQLGNLCAYQYDGTGFGRVIPVPAS